MSDSTRVLIIIVLILALLMAFAFMGSRLLLKRALRTVVKSFREHDALDATRARTQEELGLKPRGLLEFRALRDYKPMALQLLVRYNIVRFTDDGRMYLAEEMLAQTNIDVK